MPRKEDMGFASRNICLMRKTPFQKAQSLLCPVLVSATVSPHQPREEEEEEGAAPSS